MNSRIEQNTSNKQGSNEKKSLFITDKKALIGGFLAAGIALGGQWMIGEVYSGYEARRLLEAMSQAAHYFGSAVVTASATILALMLTMLSLSNQADKEFSTGFYKRVKRVGLLTTISLIGGILLLLFLSIPFQEDDSVPSHWFTIIYYIMISFLGVLSGLVVAIVLMLFNAITSLIDVVRPQANEDDENDEK